MNPRDNLPPGCSPKDCEKPNPRCDDCGAEVSGGDEPCQSCAERYEDAETAEDLRQKHLAQTMDFVNKALLGRKETQPIAKAVLEAKVMPQEQLKDVEKPYQSVIAAKLATIKERADFLRRFNLSRLDLECLDLAIDAITEQTAAAYEAMVWLDDNAPGKAREALRKGLGL